MVGADALSHVLFLGYEGMLDVMAFRLIPDSFGLTGTVASIAAFQLVAHPLLGDHRMYKAGPPSNPLAQAGT